MAMHGKAKKALEKALSEHENYKSSGGYMSGVRVADQPEGSWYSRMGILPAHLVAELLTAIEAGQVTYIVYSYATPIAWCLDDGTFRVPEVRYSQSTSGHQGIARYALGMTAKQVA